MTPSLPSFLRTHTHTHMHARTRTRTRNYGIRIKRSTRKEVSGQATREEGDFFVRACLD